MKNKVSSKFLTLTLELGAYSSASIYPSATYVSYLNDPSRDTSCCTWKGMALLHKRFGTGFYHEPFILHAKHSTVKKHSPELIQVKQIIVYQLRSFFFQAEDGIRDTEL